MSDNKEFTLAFTFSVTNMPDELRHALINAGWQMPVEEIAIPSDATKPLDSLPAGTIIQVDRDHYVGHNACYVKLPSGNFLSLDQFGEEVCDTDVAEDSGTVSQETSMPCDLMAAYRSFHVVVQPFTN